MHKVLIIEDSPDMALAIAMPLEASGYQLAFAASGQEGLEKVRDLVPDLIILDVTVETAAADCQVSLALRCPDAAVALCAVPGYPNPDTDRDPDKHLIATWPRRALFARG